MFFLPCLDLEVGVTSGKITSTVELLLRRGIPLDAHAAEVREKMLLGFPLFVSKANFRHIYSYSKAIRRRHQLVRGRHHPYEFKRARDKS